jgi:hypothetical protein
MRAEFISIEQGFDKLPTLTGMAGRVVLVNAGETALEASDSITLSSLNVSNAEIDGGTIDGTTIGGTTPAAASVTTLDASDLVSATKTSSGAEVKVQELRNNATATNTAVMQKFVNSTAAGSNSGSVELVATRTGTNTGEYTIRVADASAVMQDALSLTSGNATFSGNNTIQASHLFFDGAGSAATLSANGDAMAYGSAANGLLLRGQGSVYDVSLFNSLGASYLQGYAGTRNLKFGGTSQWGVFSSAGSDNGKSINTAGITDSSRLGTAATSHYRFYNPNGQVGAINTSGTSTSFATTSDPRAKSEFVAIDDSLAASMVIETVENGWLGVFEFLDKDGNPNGEAIAGYNAHALIDNQYTYGGTEGEGPRDAELGSVFEPAVIGQRPVMVPEMKPVLDEDGEPTGEEKPTSNMIDSGEVEDYEIEPAKIVTPAGVDQSKRVPLLEAALYNALKRIEALESA